ncbi:MAG: glycosyltransferase family 4 protein [Lentisphaerae bacterium]|nr:glycosyltransferase family 4 protein [Lentisphaerota bacterium]
MAFRPGVRGLRLLWLGPWHSDEALFGRRAVNQAATQWSRGLLRGLDAAGCTIRVCTHCREQYWPGGELLPGRKADFDASYPVRAGRYLNVPLARDRSLRTLYRRLVREEIRAFRPDIVFGYNLASYHRAAVPLLAEAGIRWVPIILDQDDPAADGWTTFTCQSRGAAGLVFLSHWGYVNCPLSVPRLHLDGGVDRWRDEGGSEAGDRWVVYSGKYDDQYGGLDLLFEMFARVRTPGCRFILTGKDPKERLAVYLRQEPRAEYRGFLAEDALHALHLRASVFVNPRPPTVSDNRMTFPSKLLHYLAYGKPVVSTWTDGLSPEYREWLLVPQQPTAEGYAALIDRALTTEYGGERLQSQRDWVLRTRTWERQAERLLAWCGEMAIP